MGLATLLKRKLGRPDENDTRKKAKAAENEAARAPRAKPTAADIPALKAKGTRTAQRKLKKLEILARRKPKMEETPKRSDGEEESDDGALEGAAQGGAALGGAYERLLLSLAAEGGAVADAYLQRRRELAGDSGGDSDSEDDEEEEEEEAQERSGGGSGDAGKKLLELERAEQPGGDALEGKSSGEDAGEGDDQLEDEPTVNKKKGGNKKKRGTAENGGGGGGEAQRQQNGGSGSTEDHFDVHLDSQLSEEALARLASAAQLGFTEAVAARELETAWLPRAKLQASEGARLPASVPQDLRQYGVRERLVTRWREVAAAEAAVPNPVRPQGDFVSPQQKALFALLSSYCDVLYPCRPYPSSTGAPDPELDAVLLHVLNHVARTSDRIKKNNDRAAAAAAGDPGDVPRDQGFTRPKVLLVLPMRNSAATVVSRLLTLALRETRTDSIQNKQRFLEEFGGEDEDEDLAGLSARAKTAVALKPAEHRALFAGNLDDHFRLGIKLTRGAVRLFTDFYNSDVLVASPLALATKLSEEGDPGAADFLSSIEIVVMERADVLQMQNWGHVATVMAAMNRLPSQQRDVDIMRVREWYLAGQAKHYRQTVVLSSFASAEMAALVGRGCANYAGRVRLNVEHRGVLGRVVPQLRQVFERLRLPPGASPAAEPDARFEHFKTAVWPRIREAARGGGQLVYVPSYFDFVRVRNFLRSESASFLAVCEYTERADMARARTYFADGRRRVLLYTERAQFYNRHRIRGVKDAFFYQLPEHPQFYEELVNLVEEESTPGAGAATASVIFSRYDALRLERVVGSDRARTMLKKKKSTFLFC